MTGRIYLDLETQWSNIDVGGWFPEKMKLSVAVTYDDYNKFRSWFEEDIDTLIERLLMYDEIVGFNLLAFDYRVLSFYNDTVQTKLVYRTKDILALIEKSLGHRIKLDDIGEATLGKTKTGSGLDAIYFWQKGAISELVAYCEDDVRLTKDLYEFYLKNNFLYYNKNGIKSKIIL